MADSTVSVYGVDFTTTITPPASSSSLGLIGHGGTGMEIETVETKFTAIGFYGEPSLKEHLQPQWKGKSASEVVEDDSGFLKALIQGPGEKLVRISIIKEFKGLSFGNLLQFSLTDALMDEELMEFQDGDEEALVRIVQCFQSGNLPKGANVMFHWPTPSLVNVSVSENAVPEEVALTIENGNVAEALLGVYLGERTVTLSTLSSVAGIIVA